VIVVGVVVVAAGCCPPVVRRLDFTTVGETSTVEVCLRRVFIVGTVCGVVGRLKNIFLS
jgi:hypothetical protein